MPLIHSYAEFLDREHRAELTKRLGPKEVGPESFVQGYFGFLRYVTQTGGLSVDLPAGVIFLNGAQRQAVPTWLRADNLPVIYHAGGGITQFKDAPESAFEEGLAGAQDARWIVLQDCWLELMQQFRTGSTAPSFDMTEGMRWLPTMPPLVAGGDFSLTQHRRDTTAAASVLKGIAKAQLNERIEANRKKFEEENAGVITASGWPAGILPNQ